MPHPPNTFHLVDLGTCAIIWAVVDPFLVRVRHLGEGRAAAWALLCAAAYYAGLWAWRWLTDE